MSKRTGTTSGVIHRIQGRTRAPGSSAIAVSSSSSRTAASAKVSPASTPPPGKTQTPGMNDCSLGPPREQDLEAGLGVAAAPAQQDDRRRRPRRHGRVAHGEDDNLPTVSATETKQLWICNSCGFIYDPDDGDPDGGIPPGTQFEDIPESWFCPVCGARKVDFEPYSD